MRLFQADGVARNMQFATLLLPFRFAASAYSGPYNVVNARCCIGLQARQHVAVEIERDRDAGVAEPLLGDLRVNAGSEHMRCMAVA